MRELKFRIWNKHAKHFCGNLKKYLLNIHTGELEVANYSDLYEEWYYSGYMENDYVIQQYTGLQDKKGKEIYEGDIVRGEFFDEEYRHSEIIEHEVVFNNGAYNIASSNWHKPSLEIVGNIFENPELVK